MRRRFFSSNSKVEYLTIEALKDDMTVSFSSNDIQYSLDNCETWETLSRGTSTPAIPAGNKVFFKATGLTPTNSVGIGTFSSTGKFNVGGNVMSLLFGDEATNNLSLGGKNYAFYKLFYNNKNIVNADKLILPATTLAGNCYSNMFYGCTSLTTAPELPATTLASYCYSGMFRDCTSLTTAPELPATTLAGNCYYNMFYGCTGLTTTPELPATILPDYCYSSMFQDCTSLTTAPELPATTLAGACYYRMFQGCTSLTTAPELPATTMAIYCYQHMFYGCTSLTTAPSILPATTLASDCYKYMFQNCSSLTTAPELPATKLAYGCYQYMFYGCSSLNYIKMLATDISATNCLYYWVAFITNYGIFVKNSAMTTLPIGASGIPNGWTVYNDDIIKDNSIFFSVETERFAADEGMTWEEWVSSDYNVSGYYTSGSYIYNKNNNLIAEVLKSDPIIPEKVYHLSLSTEPS